MRASRRWPLFRAGCPKGCYWYASASVTKSSFGSSTIASLCAHFNTAGGTIWSYSPRRVFVSKLNDVSEQSSSESKPNAASVKKATDKPSDKPPFVSEEEWLQAIQDGTTRMSEDESFRLKIARRLS